MIVSAKVARTSGSPIRSNSSTMTTRTQPRPTELSARLTSAEVTVSGTVSSSEPCSSRFWAPKPTTARSRATLMSAKMRRHSDEKSSVRSQVTRGATTAFFSEPSRFDRMLASDVLPTPGSPKITTWTPGWPMASTTCWICSRRPAKTALWLTGMAGVKTEVSLARRDSASAGGAGLAGFSGAVCRRPARTPAGSRRTRRRSWCA